MGQFKVGDKVRVKDNLKDIPNFDGGYTRSMDELIGQTVTISRIYKDGKSVRIEEDTHNFTWDVRAFEPLFIIMSKNELQAGDIVTLANGDRLYLKDEEEFEDISDDFTNTLTDMNDLNDDMTMKNRIYANSDIVKVERPSRYTTIYNRENNVKEMTIAEISKALGYEVKIVKEDK